MSQDMDGAKLGLAIASVNDLLLTGNISRCNDVVSKRDISFAIPPYQRPYKWRETNALQLLDDIIDARSNNKRLYRVGTLILHQTSGGEHHIVDGQQRIVTFSLLLKAMGDEPAFMELEFPDSPFTAYNVPRNFSALKRRISEMAGGARDDLKEYIHNQCEFIVVITEDLSEAFQFFDSQNARGKKLYPHDLLKAYHLREMAGLDEAETAAIVQRWESHNQDELAEFFADYLYCVKQWSKDNRAATFSEREIPVFKGVNARNSYPYAQFYKGAYVYADTVNTSPIPFVTGMRDLRPFQLDTPIVAGKPFFEYAAYYYAILDDIKSNDKYKGFFINDNAIVKTLDEHFRERIGDVRVRRLFDTAVLLYVDRFCPDYPSASDLDLFERFVKQAFVWAYSLRAQYQNLQWSSVQNYIMGETRKKNSFNIYKLIASSDEPRFLLAALSEKLQTLKLGNVKDATVDEKVKNKLAEWTPPDGSEQEGEPYQHYLYHFKQLDYLEV